MEFYLYGLSHLYWIREGFWFELRIGTWDWEVRFVFGFDTLGGDSGFDNFRATLVCKAVQWPVCQQTTATQLWSKLNTCSCLRLWCSLHSGLKWELVRDVTGLSSLAIHWTQSIFVQIRLMRIYYIEIFSKSVYWIGKRGMESLGM